MFLIQIMGGRELETGIRATPGWADFADGSRNSSRRRVRRGLPEVCLKNSFSLAQSDGGEVAGEGEDGGRLETRSWMGEDGSTYDVATSCQSLGKGD